MAAAGKSFEATIGVEVKGGTGKTVRVDVTVDEVQLEIVGAMVTGTGGHMVSLSAKVRRTLGKAIGDRVTVTVTKR